MKKFKMAVGACGPHIMYTNIIRANSPEEAARKYLGADAKEETVAAVSSRMFELEERTVRDDNDSFVDALGVDIEIGKDIAFISRQDKNAIKTGNVAAMTKSTITVMADDKQYRLVSDPEDGRSIRKAIVINGAERIASNNSSTDALGQPLKEGNAVAYRQDVYVNNCKGFSFGTITKVTGTYAFIRDAITKEEIRRRHDLIVIISPDNADSVQLEEE